MACREEASVASPSMEWCQPSLGEGQATSACSKGHIFRSLYPLILTSLSEFQSFQPEPVLSTTSRASWSSVSLKSYVCSSTAGRDGAYL